MTADEFRGWLAWRQQNLTPADKRRTTQQILAGVQVAAADRRGTMVSLTELIDVGVAVSTEIERRSSTTEKADEPVR